MFQLDEFETYYLLCFIFLISSSLLIKFILCPSRQTEKKTLVSRITIRYACHYKKDDYSHTDFYISILLGKHTGIMDPYIIVV